MSNKPKDKTTKIRKNRNLKREGEAIRNPVAKNMNKFNKPATHKDKTKEELEELSKEELDLALQEFYSEDLHPDDAAEEPEDIITHEYYHTGTDEI